MADVDGKKNPTTFLLFSRTGAMEYNELLLRVFIYISLNMNKEKVLAKKKKKKPV